MTPRFVPLDPATKREKPYLSVSSARLYLQCPRAFEHKYILRTRWAAPTAQAANEGIIIHEALQECNKGKIRTGEYPVDIPAIVDSILNHSSAMLTPAACVKIRPLAISLVSKYLSGIARGVHPTAAESQFLIEDPETGLRLYGFIDLCTDDGVLDYKTSATPIEHAGLHADQLHVYSLAYQAITGFMPTHAAIVNLVKPNCSVRQLDFDLDPEMIEVTLRHLRGIWGDVKGLLRAAELANILDDTKPELPLGWPDWTTWPQTLRPATFPAKLGTWCRNCEFGKDVNLCAEGFAIRNGRR